MIKSEILHAVYFYLGAFSFWAIIGFITFYGLGWVNYSLLAGPRKGFVEQFWEMLKYPYILWKNGPIKKYQHFRQIRNGLGWENEIGGKKNVWFWWLCVWMNKFYMEE